MKYHADDKEAQCCPLCNPGVCSPEVVEAAMDWAHLCQKVGKEILRALPDEDLVGELQRRGHIVHIPTMMSPNSQKG